MGRHKKVPEKERAIKYTLTKITTAIDLDVLYTLNNASKEIQGELTWDVVDKPEAPMIIPPLRTAAAIPQIAKPDSFLSRENQDPTVKEILSLNTSILQENPPGYAFMDCLMSDGSHQSFSGRGETVKKAVKNVLMAAKLLPFEVIDRDAIDYFRGTYSYLPGLEIILRELEK